MKIRVSFELDCSVAPAYDADDRQGAGEALENLFYDLSELYKRTPIRKIDLLARRIDMSEDGFKSRMDSLDEEYALWSQIFHKFHIDGQFDNSKTFTYDCEKGKIGQGVQLT